MSKYLFTILSLFFFIGSFAQSEVKMYEKELPIPTYLNGEKDKVPLFYTSKAYQGAQRRVYPYAANGNLTDKKENVNYKALILENDYLEICVLPEIGGRFYYMKDKTNGYDVIYRNNVVKPALIGMIGAWVSGGVEWNIPHHHRVSTFMPVDYELVNNDDGSKTIWVGEMEIRHQTRWAVGLTMYPDQAIVKAEIKFINQTPITNQLLVWANTAVSVNNNYQAIFPPTSQMATYHRKIDFTEWPISNQDYRGTKFENTDLSWWKNTPRGSFFSWEDKGGFLAGIDHGKDAGICVVGDPNIMTGKKLWTWGTSNAAKMWDKILTDNDGPYIELMTGAYSNNQPDYSWCSPYFTKEASMYFMPLRGMSHVKNSTLGAAVNLEKLSDNKVLIEAHGYSNYLNSKVVLINGNEVIWQQKTDLNPANPQQFKVSIPEKTSEYNLEVQVLDSDGKILVSYQPVKLPKKPLPEVVKAPKEPTEIKTVEELCFIGLRIQQIYNPVKSPLLYYKEAIKRKPKNAFANLLIGQWYLREGEFEKAEKHLETSAQTWTTNYTRSRDCEAFYLLGLTKLHLDKDAEAHEIFNIASWDYEWFGASHLQLAQLESKAGNYKKALDHINKSLSVSTGNIRALEIQLSLLRKLNMVEKHEALVSKLLKKDALNLFTIGEQLISGKANEALFHKKMRNEIQNYLSIALKFGEIGLYDDAIQILDISSKNNSKLVGNNPLVWYYKGYFNQKSGNIDLAKSNYKKASELPIDFCFPFRYETIKVLESALAINPEDAKALYYWGNLLYDHQPELAITKWEKAVSIDKQFAMAHRNIAFGIDHQYGKTNEALEHIQKAIKSDNTESIFFIEQDKYSEKLAKSPQVRLANLKTANNVSINKDELDAKKLDMQILCGEVDAAIETLENGHFRKTEGVGNIHDSWVDAWLVKGKGLMDAGKATEAISCFERSLEYPRNLEIGKNSREGQSNFFIGLAYEKSGKKKLAEKYYKTALSKGFGRTGGYYKGIALLKTGKKDEAQETFEQLIEEADKQINKIDEVDYFNVFGSELPANYKRAYAYVIKGLGYYGQDDKENARKAFEEALKYDPSNFVANAKLYEL